MEHIITFIDPIERGLAEQFGRVAPGEDTVHVKGDWVAVAEALGIPRETDDRPFETVYFSRIVMLKSWASRIQDRIIDEAKESGEILGMPWTADELETIIDIPVDEPKWANQQWKAELPLIVIDDYYDTPGLEPPTGNVLHVSAANSYTVCRAAQDLGIVTIETTNDDD